MEKLESFVKKNRTIWALIMSIISTILLFIIGFVQNKISINESTSIILNLIFIVLFIIIFKFCTYCKKINLIGTTAILLLFFFIVFITFLYFDNNKEYFENAMRFIPVTEWVNNGYTPAEKEISSQFFLLIFLIINFFYMLIINLIPNNFYLQKSKFNFLSLGIVSLIIIYIIINLYSTK